MGAPTIYQNAACHRQSRWHYPNCGHDFYTTCYDTEDIECSSTMASNMGTHDTWRHMVGDTVAYQRGLREWWRRHMQQIDGMGMMKMTLKALEPSMEIPEHKKASYKHSGEHSQDRECGDAVQELLDWEHEGVADPDPQVEREEARETGGMEMGPQVVRLSRQWLSGRYRGHKNMSLKQCHRRYQP